MIWRVILIILLFLVMQVLVRLLPIGLLTIFMVKSGVTQTSALESARTIVFEDPLWTTVIGLIIGLMGFLIVWFLVHGVEKSDFSLKAIGLDWRSNTPSMILWGALLAAVLFIAYMILARFLGAPDSSVSKLFGQVRFTSFLQNFILFMAMGFSEEVIFRVYVQTRLISSIGALWGILGTALVFTLLHQLSYQLSPITILSGVLLWTTMGAMYFLSKSLYLVGVFHGLMNTLMNTLNFDAGDFATLIVHALALIALIVYIRIRKRPLESFSNPT